MPVAISTGVSLLCTGRAHSTVMLVQQRVKAT